MAPWYIAVILGLIEGLTEFLPVSSTGHLILVGYALKFSGTKAATFEIAIQLGAILSVALLYQEHFFCLLRTDPLRRFSGIHGTWLLLLTTMPALILGFFANNYIKRYLFGPRSVALAFAVGALFILIIDIRRKQPLIYSLDAITPCLALYVGLFQCLALWPGFSRAGATIMGCILLGTERKIAAQYSFLAAVPVMCAAVGYDLLRSWRLLAVEDMIFLTIGFVISFVSAFATIKIFIALLSRCTLRPFAYYRLVLAPLVWWFWPTS